VKPWPKPKGEGTPTTTITFTRTTRASTLHLKQGNDSQGSHKEKNRNMGLNFFLIQIYNYLSMKEGNLISFVVMRSIVLRCFRSCSWCLWKALDKEGCMGLAS